MADTKILDRIRKLAAMAQDDNLTPEAAGRRRLRTVEPGCGAAAAESADLGQHRITGRRALPS